MTSSQEVTLEVATEADAPVLANLLELYVHDLSEIFAVEIGADGRFGYEYLPLYWSDRERRFAFLIRCGGLLAGFALVTRGSPASDDRDVLDLAEFFVLRSYRRAGVGRRAAFLLWDRLEGDWLVRVSENNRAGLPFWDAIIREYTHGELSKGAHPGKSQMFRVFSFRSEGRRREREPLGETR